MLKDIIMKIKKILFSLTLFTLLSGSVFSGNPLSNNPLSKNPLSKNPLSGNSLPGMLDEFKNKSTKMLSDFKKEIENMQSEIIARGLKFRVEINEQMKKQLSDITGLVVPDNKKKKEEPEKRPEKPDENKKESKKEDKQEDQGKKENEKKQEEPEKKVADDARKYCDPKAASFDWRKYGILSPVRQQGSCGSCYMFSAMASYEADYRLFFNKSVDVSEQHFLDCKDTGKCNGGWYGTVFEKMETSGGIEEVIYPYKGTTSSCRVKSDEKYFTLETGSIGKYLEIAGVDEIKEGLCKHGVLSSAVFATRMFTAYAGGVFDEHANVNGVNHAINIIGWDDSKKSWLLRNSWGEQWGENGYMWIEYGSNNVGTGTTWVSPREGK
jgi:C1A family cysteine protease